MKRVPGKVSGARVFTNTRVPFSHLFANMESGPTIEAFLDRFEGVEEWLIRAALMRLEAILLMDPRNL